MSGTEGSNPACSSEESCELQYRRRSDPHSRGRISHQPRYIGGLISYGSLAAALPFGDAVASTDMGTSPAATDPAGGLVLTGHPEKLQRSVGHLRQTVAPAADLSGGVIRQGWRFLRRKVV